MEWKLRIRYKKKYECDVGLLEIEPWIIWIKEFDLYLNSTICFFMFCEYGNMCYTSYWNRVYVNYIYDFDPWFNIKKGK